MALVGFVPGYSSGIDRLQDGPHTFVYLRILLLEPFAGSDPFGQQRLP